MLFRKRISVRVSNIGTIQSDRWCDPYRLHAHKARVGDIGDIVARLSEASIVTGKSGSTEQRSADVPDLSVPIQRSGPDDGTDRSARSGYSVCLQRPGPAAQQNTAAKAGGLFLPESIRDVGTEPGTQNVASRTNVLHTVETTLCKSTRSDST